MDTNDDKNQKDNQFVSESEYTVNNKDEPENIPPTGPMKDNPVRYAKEVGIKPTKKLKEELQRDSNDITNSVVDESANEDEKKES